MCTQLTYEGMLDEYVGIKNGWITFTDKSTAYFEIAHIEVDPALLEAVNSSAPTPTATALPSLPATKKRKHHLSAQKDKLFADIRDVNFAVVGTRLSRLARRLEGDYGGAKNLKSVSQMKDFVGKLGGLQSEQQNLRLRELLLAITISELTKGRYGFDRTAYADHQDGRV